MEIKKKFIDFQLLDPLTQKMNLLKINELSSFQNGLNYIAP